MLLPLSALAAFAAVPRFGWCLADEGNNNNNNNNNNNRQWVLDPGKGTAGRNPFDAAFAEKVNQTLHNYRIPGLSISVVKGDDTFAEGYGYASLSPPVPARPETLYYGGSTTKAFTAAAVSLLVDNGTVDWNTPLSSLIRDDFVLADKYATGHVTIEDALSHRTGLGRHDGIFGNSNLREKRDIVRGLRHLPLSAEPRTKFQYSNLMFVAVSHVVEHLTGRALAEILKTDIWTPLAMDSTFFSPQDAQSSRRDFAHGYRWNSDTKEYTELPWAPTELVSGAGSVISNVVDYTKWLRAMIHRSPPLSRSAHSSLMVPRTILTHETMDSNSAIMTGSATYSLGWFQQDYRGHLVIQHGGSILGFGAHALFIPDLEFGVTVMANTQGSSNYAALELIYHLVDEMLGVDRDERYDWLQAYANATATTSHNLKHDVALSNLYPEIPDPPIPHGLALRDYLGGYAHPVYPSFNLTSSNRRLILDFAQEDFPMSTRMEFDHVSGEYWIGSVYNTAGTAKRRRQDKGGKEDGIEDEVLVGKVGAEFKVGVEGRVREFGIELDQDVKDAAAAPADDADAAANFGDGKIWFKRIQQQDKKKQMKKKKEGVNGDGGYDDDDDDDNDEE